jgi:glycosyltransferase involved in cell wall biosynthesis
MFLISIVIPTFNRVSSIKKCIDSILRQDCEGIEVIVIDDYSTDSTRSYLQELSQASFIKLIYNRENRGVNYSRNQGIETASGRFILFLDSDDELVDGSLCNIKRSIGENPETKHFLFVVSDRVADFKHVKRELNIQYEDWVCGKISGDFTHVIHAEIMKRYLFFEQFRMYEYLNWLRIKKETSPQLLIPLTTTRRERNRSDGLTTSSKLKSVSVIKSKFESDKLYYSIYHADLRMYNPASLTYKLIKTILLGVACDEKKECRVLINYASKLHIKIMGYLIMLIPSSLLKYGIIKYSDFKA